MNSVLKDIFMQRLPFWEKLTQPEQQMLLQNTMQVQYEAGEHIHSTDRGCVGIILLQTGALRAYLLSEEGREVTLYRLYAGDVCGLSASCVVQSITFDVHIDAEESSTALLVPSGIFERLMKSNVYAECFMYQLATERFSEVIWTMQQILFMKFDQRLAIFLLDEAARIGSSEIKLTHEQVAKYMGSAREVVTRMLKYFAAENMVHLTRGGIEVLDKAKLRTYL